MRWASLISSVVLILALNAVLLIAATVRDLDSIRPTWDGLVHTIDLSLLTSSLLLGLWFWRVGQRGLGVVFAGNLVVLGVAAILRVEGYIFPPMVLFGADVYWLNLYLVCLARHGEALYRVDR